MRQRRMPRDGRVANTSGVGDQWRHLDAASDSSLGERRYLFFQAEDGIRDLTVTGVQTCALPISAATATPEQRTRALGWVKGAGLVALAVACVEVIDPNGFRSLVGLPTGLYLRGGLRDRKSVV